MRPVLDDAGKTPPGRTGTHGGPAVFAMYDKNSEIQYIGFSSDLDKSIEKLFYRRPEQSYYYRAHLLDEVDQEVMMEVRNAWFDSLEEGPPLGNRNLAEKDAWQSPVEVKGNSEGGTAVAAQEHAAVLMTQIKNRGCRTDFVPDPVLLQKGIIEFITLTEEEKDRIRIAKEEMAERIKVCHFEHDDGEIEAFELMFTSEFTTNGGYLFDVVLSHESRESFHRVIVGDLYFKHGTFEPKDLLEKVFGFILKERIPRQTEGILGSTQFSPNYFSVSELHQRYPEFEDEIPWQVDGDSFWHFRRVEVYGFAHDTGDAEKLAKQLLVDS